jgi:hypothetical protein
MRCAAARWTSKAAVRASSVCMPRSTRPNLRVSPGFGKDRPDPSGGSERGLRLPEITAYMDANFERAKGHRRWIDRKLMNGEWPVLLNIMGKGEGEERYLSVAEVRTLFVERRLPDRIAALLSSQSAPAGGLFRKLAKAALALAVLIGAAIVAIADPRAVQGGPATWAIAAAGLAGPRSHQASGLARPELVDGGSALVSPRTATFPVPYTWFVALEQPGIHLFTRPRLLADSQYLERFGFLPSPKSIRADAETLRRFGYVKSDARTEPAPESVSGLRPTPVENFDGLPADSPG